MKREFDFQAWAKCEPGSNLHQAESATALRNCGPAGIPRLNWTKGRASRNTASNLLVSTTRLSDEILDGLRLLYWARIASLFALRLASFLPCNIHRIAKPILLAEERERQPWWSTRRTTTRWACSPRRPRSKSRRRIGKRPSSIIQVRGRVRRGTADKRLWHATDLVSAQTRIPTIPRRTQSSRPSARRTRFSRTRTCARPMTSSARSRRGRPRASSTRPSSSRASLAARPSTTGSARSVS